MNLITIICLFIALGITVVNINANKLDSPDFMHKTPMKLHKKMSKREPLGRQKMRKMKLGEYHIEMPQIPEPDITTFANKIQLKHKHNSLKINHKLGPKMRMLQALNKHDKVIPEGNQMKLIKIHEKESLKTDLFEKKPVKRFEKVPVMFENEPLQMAEKEQVVLAKNKFVQMNKNELVHVFKKEPEQMIQKDHVEIIKKIPVNMFDPEPVKTFETGPTNMVAMESKTTLETASTTMVDIELQQSTMMLPTESDRILAAQYAEPKPIVFIEKEPENVQTQKPRKKHKIGISHETDWQMTDQVETENIAENETITMRKNKSPKKMSQQKLTSLKESESKLSGTDWEQQAPERQKMRKMKLGKDPNIEPMVMPEIQEPDLNTPANKIQQKSKHNLLKIRLNISPKMRMLKPLSMSDVIISDEHHMKPIKINKKDSLKTNSFQKKALKRVEKVPVQMFEKEQVHLFEKQPVQMSGNKHVQVSEKDKVQMNEKEQVQVFKNEPPQMSEKEQVQVFEKEPVRVIQKKQANMIKKMPINMFDTEPIKTFEIEPTNMFAMESTTMPELESTTIFEYELKQSTIMWPTESDSPVTEYAEPTLIVVTEKEPENIQTQKPRKKHKITLSHETDRQISDEVKNRNVAENKTITMRESDSSTLLKNKSPKLPQQKVTMVKESKSEMSGTEWEQSAPVLVTEKAPPKVQTQIPRRKHKIVIMQEIDSQDTDELDNEATKLTEKQRSLNIARNKYCPIL